MNDTLIIKNEAPKKTEPWKFKDLFVVSVIVFLFSLIALPISLMVFHSEKISRSFVSLVWTLLEAVVPLWWIKKHYNAGKEALGLRKGRWSLKSGLFIGVSVGVTFFLFELLISRKVSVLNRLSISIALESFLSLSSIDGFVTVILTPISEEIYFRGFLYGYLRSKLGPKPSLFVQALVFGFAHFTPTSPSPRFHFEVLGAFLVGLLSGLLYKASDNLYPSMIYHGTLSYLTMLHRLL